MKNRVIFSFYLLTLISIVVSFSDSFARPPVNQTKKEVPESQTSDIMPPLPENYNCIACHEELESKYLNAPVDEWKESVHREVGIKCHDCHGGAPYGPEKDAKGPESGFTSSPEAQDVPKFCARCHADAKLMRSYNQRSDQYDLYAGSVHGKKRLSGDSKAPTCVSCHGKHKNLRVKDPNAPVFRTNIPKLCGGCHSKRIIFKRRKKPFNQLALYKKSRHYELFSKGDLLVPTCVDCHGNHNIVPPKSESTQKVCFKCHSAVANFYKASPHWEVYKKAGEPICVDCHNNHDIVAATIEDFSGERDIDCMGCHGETEPAYQTGQQIQKDMILAVNVIRKANDELNDFRDNAHGGFEISDLIKDMAEASEELKELDAFTHTLNTKEFKKQTGKAFVAAKSVSKRVAWMWEEIKTRKIALMVAWFVFLVFMITLRAKAQSMTRPTAHTK